MSKETGSPEDYFRYFFDQQILEEIAQQSNLCAVQNNSNKPLLLNVMELEQFLGTVFYMACASLPNSRLHWSKVYHVADVMSRDRWEEIKTNIHFNDNSLQPTRDDENFDKMLKIRPFVEYCKRRCNVHPKMNTFGWMSRLFHAKATTTASNIIQKSPKNGATKSLFSLTTKEFFTTLTYIVAKSILFKDFQILVQAATLFRNWPALCLQ